MKTYYKFKDSDYEWRTFFRVHENVLMETICSWLCNKTLTEIYRLLFFLFYAEFKEEFEFNCSIQKTIESIAFELNFDFFDKNPVEISDGRIRFWEYKKFRLDALDWPRFFAHYQEKGELFADEVLDMLDNPFLCQLYEHFDEILNDQTLFSCLIIVKRIAEKKNLTLICC